nr:MAG TPA: hypothetical protein [Caudoviricetes sp.]
MRKSLLKIKVYYFKYTTNTVVCKHKGKRQYYIC